MALLRVLAFDHEGRPVQFDTWLDNLQLYLQSDSRDSVSLFDIASGAAPAPPTTADNTTRSQWLTRDAAARLAIRNHLPIAECAHFRQHRIAQALYTAVVARYSSPATAALGRLLLPYLFPELSAFATVEDLIFHLRTSDARYRATVPAEPTFSLDPTSLAVDLLQQHLLAAETSAIAVGAARGTPRPPFFEGCSPSPLAPSYASAAAADVFVAEDVGAASASAKRQIARAGVARVVEVAAAVVEVAAGVVVGAAVEVMAAVGLVEGVGAVVAAVEAAVGVAAVAALVVFAWGVWGSCPYVIHMGDRAGQTCGRLHTQHCFFSRLDVAWHAEFGDDVELPHWADLLRSRIAIFDLDFDAILSAMYALSISAEGDCYRCVPPDPGIATTALGASESGTLPGIALAQALYTFTLDSSASGCFFRDSTTLTPLSTPVPVRLADPSGGSVVAPSSTVLPCPAVRSGSLSGLHLPSFSANLTPLWRHCLGHPSLPRLRGMHFRLLVSDLPRSLPLLPPSPAPPCLPCIEGRQRAAPHSSFPLTSAPLQPLHMDLWGPARVSGQSRERYFLLVVDDYMRYTTVFPLRGKGQDLPVLRLHCDRGGEFSSNLLRDFCRGKGILQSFTFPDSPQKNGIVEHCIGLVMEVARTSMIHAAVCGPVRRASAQPLAPCLLAGDLAHTALDEGGWRCIGVLDVTFDESVPFYHLFPYRSAPPSPRPLFLAPGPPPIDPLLPQGPAPSSVSQVDPLSGFVPVQVAVGLHAARGATSGDAASRGAEPGGAESECAGSRGAERGGEEPVGVEPVLLVLRRDCLRSSCVSDLFGAHAFGVELLELETLEMEVLELLLELLVLEALRLLISEVTPLLVHMDVVGPTRAPSLSGSRYFLTIVDDHRRAVWVYLLKTKGEVAAAVLKEWMPRAQRESGHKVTVIRTDNGGEFIGADFEAVLKKKGIQHQLTVPYNPQQNGVAERFNQTLQEGARTLLGRAGLPDPFWGWLIWDLTSQQLIVSRDVKFLESLYYKEWKQQQQKLPTTPLIIEADEVQRPSRQVQVTVSDQEISGVTQDGGEPEVEEQQQQQDAPPCTKRPLDRPRRDVCPPNRLTYPSFGKPKVVRAGSVAEQCDEDEIAHCYWAAVTKLKMLAEALSGPDAEKWKQSVKEEYDPLLENETWELCELPPGKKAISSKLIFRHKLKKAIYGLKQAPRAWYHKLEETLLAGGFKKSECDHSLFLLQEKEHFLMLLVYVDDILLFSESPAMIDCVEEMLEMQFKCSKMRDVKYYLGMHVERDLEKGVLRSHQRKYCEGLAEKYGLQDGGKPATPLPSGFTVETCADEEVVGERDWKLFHSMVGALNYAANHTRPDIAFATSRLASVVSRPSHEQLEVAKRLVHYVSATTSMGLEYSAGRQRQQWGAADLGKVEMLLTCYTDARFNSVKADGTSIGGYVCLFGGGATPSLVSNTHTRDTGAAGSGGVEGDGAGDPTEPGAGGAGAGGAGAGGAGAVGAGAVDLGAGGARDTVRPRPYFVPLLQQVLGVPSSSSLTPPLLCPPPDQSSLLPAPSPYTEHSGGLTERRELASRPISPVRTAHRVPRLRPPPVPGTYAMALRPSSVPLRVPLPDPPESSLLKVPHPESDRARAASPTVSRLLATAVTHPSFESAAASALVVELLDFAAACRLDYATALVAESESASPLSVAGECALGMDVLEDRQEDFDCLVAAVPQAIMGPYSSQWQAAMDAEMASWKSTGTYFDEVPPPGANIVDGMWIFKVKRPLGSLRAFKSRHVARGFSMGQGVDYFQTFSPTPKMTSPRVLLHVAAQHDFELHSLDFSTAFLQGSLHEEILLRRPPGFTESFPTGTEWSLRRPVYGLR
ncbi:unnamed protein product [Closterium sp. NIES-53]